MEWEETSFDPAVIGEILNKVRIPMSIYDPEARYLAYCNDILELLESDGYSYFKEVNLLKIKKMIQRKLYPRMFKILMEKHLEYYEPIQTNVRDYVQLLCKEARLFENYKELRNHGGSKPNNSQGQYKNNCGNNANNSARKEHKIHRIRTRLP